MKTASVRDLRNSFPRVAAWINEGESVEITRSGKPFARLEPIKPEVAARPRMPDFMARMRDHFPHEARGAGLSAIVDQDRGER